MKSIIRLLTIFHVIWVFGLYQLSSFSDKSVNSKKKPNGFLSNIRFRKKLDNPRGARIRQALEYLGPIFVKLGQVLSTRRDLLPEDIADELRTSGINLIVVGIGKGVNQTELDLMAGGPQKAFSAASFDELVGGTFIQQLTEKSCEVGM